MNENFLAQNPPKGDVMPKKTKTTTNCGLFSLYPSDDGKNWKWFRFNARKNRGGLKDIATIAKKAGFIVTGPITNLVDARSYVESAIEKGVLALPGQDSKAGSVLLLRDYVKKMMDPKEPLFEWLQGDPKTQIRLRRFQSYGSSFKCRGYDLLPEDLKLVEATHDDMERFVRKLRSNGASGDVISNCIQAIRKTYKYAIEELKITKNDPTEKIKVAHKNESKREILRPYELRELLSVLESHAKEQNSVKSYAKSIYVAVKLMVHSGMREGEVRALGISKIERLLTDKGEQTKIFRIRVDSSWDDTTKTIKTTKSGKARDVFIWEDLAQILIDLYNDVKAPSGLIFCCLTNTSIPLTKNNFTDYVYPALEEIGISKEERTKRRLDIHAFRHWFTSTAEALSNFQNQFWHQQLMGEIGHESEAVHSRYMQEGFMKAYCLAKLSRDLLKEDDYREIYQDALLDA